MTDEEVRSMWESLNGNHAMLAKAKDEGLYAPSTDVVGENDVENVELLSAPLYPEEEQTAKTHTWGEDIARWWNNRNKGGSPFDTAAAAEKLKDDENADIDYELFDVGKAVSGIGETIKNTSLYTAHVYNAKNDEYLERCNEIQDKLGVNATVLSQDAFDKAWKLTQEVKQKEKLAGVTDANGHVNMDKLYEEMPYLETIHEAHGDAAALMLLNNAPGLMTINDAYSGEAERLIESVATGFERGALQFKRQLAGLGALGRGLTSDKGLTREEVQGILANAKEMESLPQYSYSSVGGALGGALGSAAENLPLMLTSMIAGAVPYVGMPLSVGVMAAEVAGGNYIDDISKVDDNGKPVYTPREAAIMALAKGLPEAILEQYKFSQIGRAILGKGTAKKLGELYAKRGAEIAGKESLEAATREIIEERVKSMAKAGILSGKEELTEEFNQAWTTAVVDNMLQSAFLGDKADLKSTEDILVESFDNALEAVPAVVGFGMMGVGGNLAVNTRGVLAMRERFKRAQGNKLWRDTYENEYRANVIETVGASLDNVEELNGKHPEMMKEILDVENEKNGVKETDVDFRALMQTSEETASQIAEAAGKTQEEVDACLNGTGIMTVDTSVLQQVSHKATPEQKQALRGNLAEVGGQTTNQIIEYAKYLNEAMNAVASDKVEEEAAAVENFVNTTFTDENDRAEALDIVAANMENPALEVRNRQRENQAALDEIFNPVLNGLRAGMGQGVDIIRQEDGRGVRVSNNAEWYRNFFADHGRAPTEEELREIAYENIIGTATRYADSQITLNDGTPEAQEYFTTVKAEIDGLREEQARLSRMLDVFSNYKSGEFMAQAAMPEGAREAYQTIYNVLKASGVKNVSTNARVNAILAARIAERVAQEYRAAGQKDVTALSVLPQIMTGVVAQDTSALNQFAGENAKGVEASFQKVLSMLWKNKTPEEIFKETGWFRGKDGKWRFEIPDDVNKIEFAKIKTKRGVSSLEKVYDNPALYEAYPFLKKIRVVAEDYEDEHQHGRAYGRTIGISKKDLAEDEDEACYTLVHEIQHLIQKREGFASGGTAEYAREVLGNRIKNDSELSKLSDDELYWNLAGEQEARNTEDRADIRLGLSQALEDKADAEEKLAEALKNKDEKAEDEARKALFVATMQERQARNKLEKMPIPHDENAIVIFGDSAVGKVSAYNQQVNATIQGQYTTNNIVSLFESADQSTFMHEMSHFYLNELGKLAEINPDGQAAKDFVTVSEWAEWHDGDAEAFKGTAAAKEFAEYEKEIKAALKAGDEKKAQDYKLIWKQEKFARAFEEYLHSGKAPTTRLQKIFRAFKTWLSKIYNDVIGVGVKPSAEVEAVMARMVASDEEIELHAKLKEAESVARKAPDLLDKETGDMYERWEQEAKEEAKEKLLKELIKEQEEKDVAEHMEAFEESERERLAQDPAFGVIEMMETTGLTQEEACEIAGYNSVEAWKQDIEKKGGSFDAALSASMEAERERYIKEMPNQERLSQMAEEAFAASDYSQQLSALEAEILKRRIDKYRNKATYLLSRALADVEAAINGDPETLHQKILALRYAHRWNKGEAEQIDKMNKIVDDVQLAEEQRREKLKAEYDKLKESTMLNREWLRGVRDAAKGVTKDIKQVVIQQLNSMSAKDATNFRRFVNEAKKAAQESVKHLSAAARAKENDAGEREYELARQAKMRQTMFEMMSAEALKYRRALQKVQNDMKRVQKGLVSAKGEIDASTRYYIGHIQYMLGFRNSDAPMPQNFSSFDALFRSLKSTNGENGSVTNIGDIDGDVDIPQWLHALILSENGMPKQYKDFTIEELQDMQALVDMLYKTARNKNRMLSEGLEGKVVSEITAELHDDFQKTVTVEKGDEGINRYFARILKPVVMLKTLGTTWEKYFYRTLFDGWEKQERMQMKAAEELNALFDKYYKDKATRRDMRTKELSVTMPDGTPLTKEMVLAMAMNWGNAGNRLRLRDGMTVDFAPASETDIENIFKQVLTANDWAFVQEAWDYINTYGDPVNDVVESLTGVPMKRVEPLPFTVETSDGTRVNLRGGYYPIAYDPKKSTLKAEQELTTSAKAFGGMVFGTGMGSTKARAQAGLEDSPLLLSMDVLFNHVNQQIHIAAMRLPARDVYKLLQNKEIRYMVEHSIGREAYMELKRWCENVWQKPLDDRDPVKQFLEMGRRNTVGAIMGYRMSVAVLNTLPNFVLMVRELGAMNALEACLDCWTTKGSRAWILEDSPFMRNRANNIDRDIKHAQQESFAPQNPVMDAISRTSGWLIEQTDMIFSLPTYHWTYKKTLNAALEKGATQEQAAKEAHYAAGEKVRKIFGSAETVDQSYYQRSNDVVIKALTPFYTYVSTQANVVFEEYMKGRYQGSNVTITDEGERKAQKKAFMERWGDMMHAVLFTYVLETAVEQLMRDGITYLTRGDDDEPWDFEGFMRRYASQSLTTFTSALPIVNLGGEAMGQWITGENYPTRGFGITSAAIDRGSKVISDIKKTIQGKGDAIETGRDVAKLVGGTLSGFPDTLTDTVFNLARAYNEDYSAREVFWKSFFDKRLKPKDNKKKRKPKKERK